MNETTTHMQATGDLDPHASPQPCLGGGACPSQHAPPASFAGPAPDSNPYPQGRWSAVTGVATQAPGGRAAGARTPRGPRRSANPPLPADVMEAPLRELFWSEPDADRLTDAEQRIADFLNASLKQQQIQLFDDLYEAAAH